MAKKGMKEGSKKEEKGESPKKEAKELKVGIDKKAMPFKKKKG